MQTRHFFQAIALSALVAACSSVPTTNPEFDSARTTYQRRNRIPTQVASRPSSCVRPLRPTNVPTLRGVIAQMPARVDQLAYLSRQASATAIQAGRQRAAEDMISLANRDRDRIVLEARTREAARAEAAAADARQRAEIAQASAGLSAAEAESARRQAEQSQQQALAMRQQAEQSQAQAQQSQQQAQQSLQEAQAMRQSAEEQRNRALALQQ